MAERDFTANFNANTAGLVRGAQETRSVLKDIGKVAAGIGLAKIAEGAAGEIVKLGKEVIEFDEKLLRMKLDNGMSTKQMEEFNLTMRDAAMATSTSNDAMLQAGNAALKFGGKDMVFVNENLKTMGTLMKASGAGGEEVGRAFGVFHNQLKMTGPEIEKVMGSMYAMSTTKFSKTTFRDFLPTATSLMQTYKALYPKASLKEINEYLAMAMYSPNPQSFARAFRGITTQISKSSKAGRLHGDFFAQVLGMDPREGVPSVARIMDRIIKLTHGKTEKELGLMKQAFGRAGLDLMPLLNMSMEEFKKALAEADPAKVFTDAAEASNTLASRMTEVHNILMDVAGKALTGPLEEFAKQLKVLTNDPTLLKGLEDSVTAIATVLMKALEYLAKFTVGFEDLATKIAEKMYGTPEEDAKTLAINQLTRARRQEVLTRLDNGEHVNVAAESNKEEMELIRAVKTGYRGPLSRAPQHFESAPVSPVPERESVFNFTILIGDSVLTARAKMSQGTSNAFSLLRPAEVH